MKPMLLANFAGNEVKVYRAFRDGVWVQPKIDGVRCIVSRPGQAWGRSGPLPLAMLSPDVWRAAVVLLAALPGDCAVDGELYSPSGTSPAEIGRAIQTGSAVAGLRFAAFDLVQEEALFSKRLEILHSAKETAPRLIDFVRTEKVTSKADIDSLMADTRASGGEGLVLRLNAPYAQGQRQPYAFKLKAWENGSGKIIGLRQQSVEISCDNGACFWVKAAPEWIQAVRIGDQAHYRYCGRSKEAGTPLNASLYW